MSDSNEHPAAEGDRRSRRRKKTRSEILEAAGSLVIQQGLEGFSLRAVARDLDMSPGALYRYFDDKDALLDDLATEALYMLGSYMEAVPLDLPPTARLLDLGLAYITFAEEHPAEYALVSEHLKAPETDWHSFVEHSWPFTILVDATWEAVDAGDIPLHKDIDPGAMAYGVWAMAHGMASLRHSYLAAVSDNRSTLDHDILQTYIRGLTNTWTRR